ncbi:MAG: YwbE family protein [Candidatus Paceibacterota bacterium]|jgi:uncharacterized repeat protein (TIGR03833 family)|nr:YwbE family protein [Candidatus Paceibacterota bacterium]MDD4830856.1 YwbE family protein [Candidatus Paceibacterota bacterium]MDD4875089.1 YwbE family protein [Candidatus Paceibacterota bacterium]
MDGRVKAHIKIGIEVDVITKIGEPTGKLTRGIVAEILTSIPFHPQGVKVRLEDGQVGRIKKIIQTNFLVE